MVPQHFIWLPQIAIFVLKLIIENVANKNPKNNDGTTTLHLAATNSIMYLFENLSMKMLQIRIQNGNTALHVENENPGNNFGTTPFHLAVVCSSLFSEFLFIMKWCGTVIISWIFIFNIFIDQLANKYCHLQQQNVVVS